MADAVRHVLVKPSSAASDVYKRQLLITTPTLLHTRPKKVVPAGFIMMDIFSLPMSLLESLILLRLFRCGR